MASLAADEKRPRSRSPAGRMAKKAKEKEDFTPPPAVKDNDIFSLPSSDYQILAGLTAIGICIRLFRLSQPTSVVFDEVQ